MPEPQQPIFCSAPGLKRLSDKRSDDFSDPLTFHEDYVWLELTHPSSLILEESAMSLLKSYQISDPSHFEFKTAVSVTTASQSYMM